MLFLLTKPLPPPCLPPLAHPLCPPLFLSSFFIWWYFYFTASSEQNAFTINPAPRPSIIIGYLYKIISSLPKINSRRSGRDSFTRGEGEANYSLAWFTAFKEEVGLHAASLPLCLPASVLAAGLPLRSCGPLISKGPLLVSEISGSSLWGSVSGVSFDLREWVFDWSLKGNTLIGQSCHCLQMYHKADLNMWMKWR